MVNGIKKQQAKKNKQGNNKSIAALWDRSIELCANRYVVGAVFIMLIAVIFVRYAEPLQDNDLWWHMEYGEYMVKNLTLKPDHAIYSWTIADPNWIYNGWIPEIFFYLVHAAGGPVSLHISQYAFLTAIFALFIYFAYAAKQQFSMFHLLSLSLMAIAFHINVSDLRPEIFSVLFLCLTVFIYFYSRISCKEYFYLYPPLTLVWANSHGVFLFGIVFITVAFAGEVVNYLIKKEALSKEMLKAFFVSVLFSYMAIVITPFWHKWILNIIISFTDPQFLRQAKNIMAYKNIFLFGHPTRYILVAFSVSYLFLALYALVFRKRVNAAVIFVNILFIYFSFMYARSAYYYLPVWYFSTVYTIKMAELERLVVKMSPLFLTGFLVFSLWSVDWTIKNPRKYKYLGFGVGEYMPESVSEFLLKYDIEGPMFNTYEIGGYLLWKLNPRYRVFIDPRHGPYSKHLVDEYRQFELGNGFKYFTDKYIFKFAIVKLEWKQLINNFFDSSDWKLIFFDQSSALFVHKSVNVSKINADMSPERFKDLKAYESYIYTMAMYLNMEDFKSAWYIFDRLKLRYNYGDFINVLDGVEKKLKEFEEQAKAKKKT